LFTLAGPDPYGGPLAPNEFRPNYNYVAGKEIFDDAALGGPIAATYLLREWASRNVSGLKASRLVTTPRVDSTKIVLFHDRASTYHAPGSRNIYTQPGDWRYYASFGYLDGHAEAKTYRNKREYLAALHPPIAQKWWGVEFAAAFPEQYTGSTTGP
jgi:hypothetical protein